MERSPAILRELDIPALFGSNENESAWTLFMRLTGQIQSLGQETIQEAGKPALESATAIQAGVRDQLVQIHLDRKSLGVPARRARNAIQHVLDDKNPGSPRFSAQPDFVIDEGEETPRFGPGNGFAYLANLHSPDWHRHWRTGASPQAPMEWEMQIHSVMWAAERMGSNLRWALILPQIGLHPPQAPILVKKDPEICSQVGKAILEMLKRIQDGGPEPSPKWHADREAYLALARKRGLQDQPDPIPDEEQDRFREACESLAKSREELSETYQALDNIRHQTHVFEEIIANALRRYGKEGHLDAGEFSASILEERQGEGTYKAAPGEPAPMRRSIQIRRNIENE